MFQLARILHTPWHKLLVCIPPGATFKCCELADTALDGASSSENMSEITFQSFRDWPCTLKASYHSALRGDHGAGGVTISMLHDDDDDDDDDDDVLDVSSALFFGKCRNGLLAEIQACCCALLCFASLLASVSTPTS